MEFVLRDGPHVLHSAVWVLYSPHHQGDVCLGCIVELLEDPQLLPLQRRPALSELARLMVHQDSDLLELFMQEEMVVWHLCTLLLDNLLVKDESYSSLSIEALLRLIQLVHSEDLVSSVITALTQKVQTIADHTDLLPHYTLLGKMLHQLPALAFELLHNHGGLLQDLSLDLDNAGETIQSSIAYIFIFLCFPDNLHLLSPRLHHQLHLGTLSLLSSAKTLSVQMNGLGLLRKLLVSDEACQSLMTTTNDGVSLVTCLKKLLLSKQEVLQIGVGQVLSVLLGKPEAKEYGLVILDCDIAEFLFEALNTQNTAQLECLLTVLKQLSHLDQFYKRCHAVYGLESILRAICIAEGLRNPVLLYNSHCLLASVLARQPISIPLFVNGDMVRKCLTNLQHGITHHQARINSVATQALTALVRKEHLLSPVPFSEVKEAITMVTKKAWDQLRNKSCKADSVDVNVLRDCLNLVVQACQLAIQCCQDRTSCESNFAGPPSGDGLVPPDYGTTLDMFVQMLFQVSDETCLPIVMMHWSKMKEVCLYSQSLKLVCLLDDLDSMVTNDLLYKLVEAGFLSNVIDAKITFSDGALMAVCTRFLNLCLRCCQKKGLLPDNVSADMLCRIDNLQWVFSDLPQVLHNQDVPPASVEAYLLMLFLSYIHDNRVLTKDGLQWVLSAVIGKWMSLQQLSPLAIKHFLYLLAWSCIHNNLNMRASLPHGVDSVRMVLQGPVNNWYTHSVLLVQWCFNDIILSAVAGEIMIKAYLGETTMHVLQQHIEGATEEGRILLQLCDNQQFTDGLLVSLACQSAGNCSKILLLLDAYVENQSGAGEVTDNQSLSRENTPSVDDHRKSWIRHVVTKVTEVLQNVFLKNYSNAADHNIESLLKMLLSVSKFSNINIDVKILYHVLTLLVREGEITDSMQQVCLLTILAAITSCTTTDNQVSAMLVQHEELMGFLERCIRDHEHPLYCIVCDITTSLILQPTLKGASNRIHVDLPRVLHGVCQCTGDIQVASVNLLAALFDSQMSSDVVTHEGRIYSSQYRTLYIYLQQLLLQDISGIQEPAMECMEKMVKYLLSVDASLGEELLAQPWNRVLLDVCIDLHQNMSTTSPHTRLYIMFCKHEASCTWIRSSPGLVKKLVAMVTRQLSSRGIAVETYSRAQKILTTQILKHFHTHLSREDTKALQIIIHRNDGSVQQKM